MVRMTTVMILAAIGLSTAAKADVAAGDACASNLSAVGKSIYAAVVAANPTISTLRETVRSQARGMVMGGQISRDDAEANAVPAAECVRVRLQ
ncbi:MAG: hypothetical protein ACOY4R_21780 [Pseudomonadota bacterium]